MPHAAALVINSWSNCDCFVTLATWLLSKWPLLLLFRSLEESVSHLFENDAPPGLVIRQRELVISSNCARSSPAIPIGSRLSVSLTSSNCASYSPRNSTKCTMLVLMKRHAAAPPGLRTRHPPCVRGRFWSHIVANNSVGLPGHSERP